MKQSDDAEIDDFKKFVADHMQAHGFTAQTPLTWGMLTDFFVSMLQDDKKSED